MFLEAPQRILFEPKQNDKHGLCDMTETYVWDDITRRINGEPMETVKGVIRVPDISLDVVQIAGLPSWVVVGGDVEMIGQIIVPYGTDFYYRPLDMVTLPVSIRKTINYAGNHRGEDKLQLALGLIARMQELSMKFEAATNERVLEVYRSVAYDSPPFMEI